MKKISHIISLLIILFLTGCYPGEDFGINVTMYVEETKGGLCSANITSYYQIHEGNPLISEIGVCWEEANTDILPTVKKKTKKSDNVATPYSIVVTGLKESTWYVARPYMLVNGFYVYGDIESFKTPSNSEFLPQLSNLILVKSELDKLSVSSKITSVPIEYPVTEVGICYTDQSLSNFTSEMKGVKTVKATLSDGKFDVDVTGLDFSTTYEMRAYAKNQAGTIYGIVESFRTSGDEYVPLLGKIDTKISPTYLEVSCKVSESLRTDSVKGWFEYSRYYDDVQLVEAKIEEGVMKAKIANLYPSTNYSIIAKAENKFGIGSSSKIQVTTDNGEKSKPTVDIPVVTNITVSEAKVESVVKIIDSNYKALSGGFIYSTSNNMNSSVTQEAVLENDTILKLDLMELSDNTEYYIQAYIETELGKIYSDKTTFSTLECKPSISDLNVKTVSKTSVSLSAMVTPYDENHLITEAGVQYTTNSSIHSGDTKIAGTITGDSVCVDLLNITKGTSYIMRAYAVAGDKYFYGSAKNVVTKKDSDYAPSFEDLVVSDIAMTSLKLSSGFNQTDQTYKITEAGFQYYRSTNSSEVKYGKMYVGEIIDGKITLSVSDLTSGSTYQVRAYLKFDDDVIYYGNVLAVKTNRVEDYIGNVKVSNILLRSAELEARIDNLPSGYDIVEAGFDYDELSGNLITKEATWVAPIVNNVMKLDVKSLKLANTHRVRAFVKCGSAKYYGEFTNFETLSTSVLPSVSCNDITAVNSSSFSIEAGVKENHELYPITETGFIYIKSTSSAALTLNTNNAIRKPIAVQDGKIKLVADGLDNNSTYLVRAYVISGDEISYNEKTIKVYTNMDNYKATLESLSVDKTNGEYIASCKATVSQVFPVMECGFVYSMSTSSPTVESNDGIVSAQLSESNFSTKILLERPETGSRAYYVRAYAKNTNGISYSSYKKITVLWND